MARSPAELLAATAWKLHQSGQLEEAIGIYRRAAAIAPDYAEIHNNLGNALRSAGQTTDAVASLRRAAKLKPDVATVHTNLGLALAELGRFEEAAELVGSAVHGRFNATAHFVLYRNVLERTLREHLDDGALQAAMARGRDRAPAQALAAYGVVRPA